MASILDGGLSIDTNLEKITKIAQLLTLKMFNFLNKDIVPDIQVKITSNITQYII